MTRSQGMYLPMIPVGSTVVTGRPSSAPVPVEVPEGNAVLHRHHHRVRPEQLGYVRSHRLDLVRLQGEHHHVLRSRGRVIQRRLDPRDRDLGAVAHHQPDAPRLQRFQGRSTRDEGDILARVRELRSDKTADGARPYDRDPHPRASSPAASAWLPNR